MVSGWIALGGADADFGQLTVEGLVWGAIYALMAIGYTLTFRVLRFINLAHSGVFLLGTFGAYFALDVILGFAGGNTYDLGAKTTVLYLGIAMLIAMVVSGTTTLGLEALAFRPLRRRAARPVTFLIVSIGLAFAIQEFVHRVLPTSLWGHGGNRPEEPIVLVTPSALFTMGPLELGGLRIPFPHAVVSNVTVVVIVVALVLAVLTDVAVYHTKFGRAVKALAQDRAAATLMGVSSDRIIVITLGISGVLAGAAGFLYTLHTPGQIVYSVGFILGFKALVAAVLGGLGSVRGAVLGAVLLGLVESYSQAAVGSQWRDAVVFAILVLVLILRPGGILRERAGTAAV